jgi:hypothetical protein
MASRTVMGIINRFPSKHYSYSDRLSYYNLPISVFKPVPKTTPRHFPEAIFVP